MADEVIIQVEDHGAELAADVSLGDVITLDSAAKWAATADGDRTWFAALTGGVAADGDRVAGVKERVMKVNVTAVAAVAVGDELYVGAGALTEDGTGRELAGARAMEAIAAPGSALIKVLVA